MWLRHRRSCAFSSCDMSSPGQRRKSSASRLPFTTFSRSRRRTSSVTLNCTRAAIAGEGKVQTVMFRDRPTIDRNAAVTDDFIRRIGDGKDSPPRPGPGDKKAQGTLWTGIAGRDIAEYLKN